MTWRDERPFHQVHASVLPHPVAADGGRPLAKAQRRAKINSMETAPSVRHAPGRVGSRGMARPARPSLPAALLVASIAPLLGSAALGWIPALHQRLLAAPLVCWSRLLLGRDCAGCGLTRSFVAIARGEPSEALQWNPLGPVLYLYLCAMVVVAAGAILIPRFRWWRRITTGSTMVLLAWIAVDTLVFYFG
jgi:hypothetical protein